MKLTKFFIVFSLLILLIAGCSLDETTGPKEPVESNIKLFINEFMASNDAATADPDDDGSGDGSPYDDWIEIYNADSAPVNIGGMYLTDNLENLKMWQVPTSNSAATTIPAGGFLVLWADSETDQGVLHADFKLSGGGEDIAIVESNGITIIDSYTYVAQQTDYSFGRVPDGADTWEVFSSPTPGVTNAGASTNVPPVISNINISPDSLTDATPVTVSAEVTDPNDNLNTVILTYGVQDSLNTEVSMTLDGTIYKAELGIFADGTRVLFFITAKDVEDATAQSDTLSFEVGYIAPVLYINEFLASNDSCCTDENGEYDDWIEIYNPGPDPVDIGGMYISDDATDLTAWQIPTTAPDSTTIQPGGFLVLWGDKQTEQGILHVELKLSSGGEDLVITAPNGTTVIDSYTFGEQTTDVSVGRKPDGSDNWVTFETPTPGASNN